MRATSVAQPTRDASMSSGGRTMPRWPSTGGEVHGRRAAPARRCAARASPARRAASCARRRTRPRRRRRRCRGRTAGRRRSLSLSASHARRRRRPARAARRSSRAQREVGEPLEQLGRLERLDDDGDRMPASAIQRPAHSQPPRCGRARITPLPSASPCAGAPRPSWVKPRRSRRSRGSGGGRTRPSSARTSRTPVHGRGEAPRPRSSGP